MRQRHLEVEAAGCVAQRLDVINTLNGCNSGGRQNARTDVAVGARAREPPVSGLRGERRLVARLVVKQPQLRAVLEERQLAVREFELLAERVFAELPVDRVFDHAGALPGANHPGQRNQFGLQPDRNLDHVV